MSVQQSDSQAIVVVCQEQGLQFQESLAKLLAGFLDSQDVSLASRETYKRELRQFFFWLQGQGLNLSLAREDILAYKRWLQEGKKLSVYSVNGYLVALRRFYTWLQAQGLYPNVCEVKGAKKPRGFSKDTFTPGQLRDILSGIDTASLDGLRDFALVNLLARTALRTIELARANVGDLRQESGQAVLYIQGKGRASKDDFVILTDEAERPLRKYLHARAKIEGRPLQDSFPLFSSLSDRNRGQGLTPRSISRTCKAAFRQAGLDSSRLTAHSLRHTGITLALKGGASIQQAQAMARHADISTTMIYAHNLDRVSQAAERCIQF